MYLSSFTHSANQLAEYTNGNHTVTIYEDGTKVKSTIDPSDEYFTYEFPENFDLKINDRCSAGCQFCHENSTSNGKVPSLADFVLSPLYKSIKSGTEMAIGGGNIFESRELSILLFANKKRNIISNITINQKHLSKNFEILKMWVKKKLVHGIGISLGDYTNQLERRMILNLSPNVVVHTIVGLLDINSKALDFIKDMKVLFLGYKNLRRGEDYLIANQIKIDENVSKLKKFLADGENLGRYFKTLSFDCLAIKQLGLKEMGIVSQKEWDQYFQGDDYDVTDEKGNITCATMYIDLPNKKVARTSTEAARHAFEYTDSIQDLFKKSTIIFTQRTNNE